MMRLAASPNWFIAEESVLDALSGASYGGRFRLIVLKRLLITSPSLLMNITGSLKVILSVSGS